MEPAAQRTNSSKSEIRSTYGWPITLADRYLVTQVAGASLRGLLWFAGLFLAFAIVTGAKRIVQDEIPFFIAIQMVLVQIPRIVLFTIPASLLYGTVQTFTEMSAKGEITALFSGGMSLARMVRAPLIFAGLMVICAFYLQEVLVPGSEFRKAQLLREGTSRLGIIEGFKVVSPPGSGSIERIVQADSFDASKKIFYNPVIQIFRADRTLEFEVKAERALWDAASTSWVFEKGVMKTKSDGTGGLQATFESLNRFEKLSVATDKLPQPDTFQDASKGIEQQMRANNFEMASWQDLAAYRERLKKEKELLTPENQRRVDKSIYAVTFGIHDKFATPLICLALILVGAPLGVRPQRTASAGLAMGLSLVALIAYYLVWTLSSQIGKGGAPFPLIPAYLPLVVTTTIGLVLMLRKS